MDEPCTGGCREKARKKRVCHNATAGRLMAAALITFATIALSLEISFDKRAKNQFQLTFCRMRTTSHHDGEHATLTQLQRIAQSDLDMSHQ